MPGYDKDTSLQYRALSATLNVSCRIFEHFALQTDPGTEFIKLGSGLFKEGATLAPKLADPVSFWRSGSTPSKTQIQ
jgi:hypothetical protein